MSKNTDKMIFDSFGMQMEILYNAILNLPEREYPEATEREIENEIKREKLEMDDGHDCHLSPEDGCDHPSHLP